MTVALWFAVPARRQVVVWTLAMLVSTLFVFSVVFASLFNVTNLVSVIAYTTNHNAGRYLLPVLLAWFATIMTLFFADVPSSASTPGTGATVPYPPAFVSSPVGVKADPETSKKQQDKQQPPN
jgi:hypothetical protein